MGGGNSPSVAVGRHQRATSAYSPSPAQDTLGSSGSSTAIPTDLIPFATQFSWPDGGMMTVSAEIRSRLGLRR